MPMLNTLAGAFARRMPKAISPKGHAIADYVAVAGFLQSNHRWLPHLRVVMAPCGWNPILTCPTPEIR